MTTTELQAYQFEKDRADELHEALQDCLDSLVLAASTMTDFVLARYGIKADIERAQRALDDGARSL